MPIWRTGLKPSRWLAAPSMIPAPKLLCSRPHLRLLRQHVCRRSYAAAAVTSTPSSGKFNTHTQNAHPETSTPAPGPTAKPTKTLSFAERLEKEPFRPHPPGVSVVVTPILPSPHMSELKLSKHKHAKSLFNQLRIQTLRDLKNLPDPDWRKILQDLSALTPSRSEWRTAMLEVPTASLDGDHMLRADEVGLRAIMAKTGCAIETEVRPAEDAGKEVMLVTIYAPPSRMQAAVDMILELVGKATYRSVVPNAAGSGAETSHAGPSRQGSLDVEAINENYGPAPVDLLAFPQGQGLIEAIPHPDVWTAASLDKYIATTTNRSSIQAAKKTRLRQGNKGSHTDAVVKSIFEVFKDPEALSAITHSSFHRALSFIVRRGPRLRRDEVALFSHISRHRRDLITTETFNIILAGHAHVKDMGRFHQWLRLMDPYGCIPNFRTWLITLSMFDSAEIRRYILHLLGQKGMLESPTAIRRIAVAMAPHDIQLALEQGLTLDQIMARQDALYGGRDRWLTRRGGNQGVDVLCRHGRFEDALALVKHMAAPDRPTSLRPDVITLNTILTHSVAHRLPRVALGALALDCWTARASPELLSYKLLFKLFWNARMPLAVNVIWHYAIWAGVRPKFEYFRPVWRTLRNAKSANPGRAENLYHGAMLSALMPSLGWITAPSEGRTCGKNQSARENPEPSLVAEKPQMSSPLEPRTTDPSSGHVPEIDAESSEHGETVDANRLTAESFLAAKYPDQVPAPALHVVLQEAVKLDSEAHREMAGLLAASRSVIHPEVEDTTTASPQAKEPTPEPGQGRSGGVPSPATSRSTPSALNDVPSFRKQLKIPLRSKHCSPMLSEKQLELAVDYSSIYRAREQSRSNLAQLQDLKPLAATDDKDAGEFERGSSIQN